MKVGKSINEVANELQLIKDESHDYVAPLGRLTMEVMDNTPKLTMEVNEEKKFYTPTSWAAGQVSSYTNIPKQYYDRIYTENPHLVADMINHGLDMANKNKRNTNRMIRTVNDNMRAFLSPRYRTLDCIDLLEAIFPLFLDKGLTIESCQLTETKLYLKALSRNLIADVKVGDPVQYGLCVSGSDVGCGSVKVEPLLYRLRCKNGWISSIALRKYHIGKAVDTDDNMEILTDETRAQADKAFWMACRDTVVHSLKEDVFNSEVDMLKEASGQEIKNTDINKVVERTAKEVGVLGEETKQSVVAYLANGADGAGFNKYGLAQAFSYAAQDDKITYDNATELERASGKVYEIPDELWNKIAA